MFNKLATNIKHQPNTMLPR